MVIKFLRLFTILKLCYNNRMLKITIDHCLATSVLELDNLGAGENLLAIHGCQDVNCFGEKAFYRFIMKHMLNAALSLREREASFLSDAEKLKRAMSHYRVTTNQRAKGSEIAEICLYGVMADYYKAVSSVPKIYYKQSRDKQVNGADSVHVVVDSTGEFSIWLGEAKFYKAPSVAAYKDITTSIVAMLDPERLEIENRQIAGLPDLKTALVNDEMYQRIQAILDSDGLSQELISVLHVPIMLLYGSNKIFGGEDKLIEDQKAIATNYFKQHLEDISKALPMLKEIKYHLILFPVSDKKSIVGKVEDTVLANRRA